MRGTNNLNNNEDANMEIGVDCVDIDRFYDIINDKKLLHKIFTAREIEYCKAKKPFSQHFAARFAGKEAVIKALSHYNIRISLNQIEILNNKNGRPFVRILNDKYELFEIKISLSHSKEIAMAMVAVIDSRKTLKNKGFYILSGDI